MIRTRKVLRPINLASASLAAISVILFFICAIPSAAQDVLPFPPQPSGSTAKATMQESIYSPAPTVSHVPKGSPNVIIVLIDDVGPGLPDTYGGEIDRKSTRLNSSHRR